MNRDKAILLMFLFVGMLIMFGIPLWISAILVVIVVAIFLIAPTILKIPRISSSIPKLPTLNIKTILVVLLVIMIALSVIHYVGPGVRYSTDRKEGLSNNSAESFRGYNIEGNYKIENNALHIIGTCVITRKTNVKQPWIAFDASGGALAEVDILDNNLPDYGYDNFKSGQVVIIKDKRRNYLFTVKGDFYRLYIDGKLAEDFGIAEGGRAKRERTYRIKIKSVTPEGVWIDNIESK